MYLYITQAATEQCTLVQDFTLCLAYAWQLYLVASIVRCDVRHCSETAFCKNI